jgi:hypothetical protein
LAEYFLLAPWKRITALISSRVREQRRVANTKSYLLPPSFLACMWQVFFLFFLLLCICRDHPPNPQPSRHFSHEKWHTTLFMTSPTFSLLLPDGRLLRTSLSRSDIAQILSRAGWSAVFGSYADHSAVREEYSDNGLEGRVPPVPPTYRGGLDLHFFAIASDAVAAQIAHKQRHGPLPPLLIVPLTSAAPANEQIPPLVSLFLRADADITDGRDMLHAYGSRGLWRRSHHSHYGVSGNRSSSRRGSRGHRGRRGRRRLHAAGRTWSRSAVA